MSEKKTEAKQPRGKREISPDSAVARMANLAKSVAKTRRMTPAAAFTIIGKDLLQEMRPRPRPMSALERSVCFPDDPPAGSEQEQRRFKELTLRIDLEAALLVLDAHANPSKPTWPTEKELETLSGLVFKAAWASGKRKPVYGWPCWRRVDRHFPKLGLICRLKELLDRMVKGIPGRSLAVLMHPWKPSKDEDTNEQAKAFFAKMEAIRNEKAEAFFAKMEAMRKAGVNPADEDWQPYESVLLRYQHDGKKNPLPILTPIPGSSHGLKAEVCYRAFMDLDRTDLQWCRRHWPKVSPLIDWMWLMSVPRALWKKLECFYAIGNTAENAAKVHKRKQAKDRQAKWKSRKLSR